MPEDAPPPAGADARANELIALWTATLQEARDTNRRVDFLIRRLLAAGVITVEKAQGAPGGSLPSVRTVARRAGSAVKTAGRMVEELRRMFGRP